MKMPSFTKILLIVALAVGCINFYCMSQNNAKSIMYWKAQAKEYEEQCDAYNVYYHTNERLLDEIAMNYKDVYDNDFNILLTSEFGNNYMDAKRTVDSLCYQKILDE